MCRLIVPTTGSIGLHRLRAARERWLASLSPEMRQYLDEAWLTTCDRAVREQYLIDHALTYPAGS